MCVCVCVWSDVYVCARARVRACGVCARACVCVRACMRARVCVYCSKIKPYTISANFKQYILSPSTQIYPYKFFTVSCQHVSTFGAGHLQIIHIEATCRGIQI